MPLDSDNQQHTSGTSDKNDTPTWVKRRNGEETGEDEEFKHKLQKALYSPT